MKRSLITGLLIIIAILAGGVGFWLGIHHVPSPRAGDDDDESAPTSSQAEAPPVAQVQTIPLRQGTIQQTITAYGSIIAQPGDVRIVSVAFESRITRVVVAPGQPVSAGMPLVELAASPDALVALEEARNSVTAAGQDLQRTQQRFNDHLATAADLATAKQALQSAQLKLNSMTHRGVGEAQTLNSESPGIVSKIDVQEGQIVPAGSPLVEIAAGKHIEASLGVEPTDAAKLSIGQPVELSRVGENPGEPIEGKVRVIGRRVDPSTRMVNVNVSLPPDSNLLLDTFIAGRIVLASSQGWIVPRNAVVPRADGSHVIFTVSDGAAKEHVVELGLENDQESQIKAAGLSEGDPVVVANNSILEDGMKVEARSSATQPSEEPP